MPKGNLSKDQERLAKLWDAYEIQEKELELSVKKISTIENQVQELDRVNSVLKKVVEDRDKEIRDLELKVVSLEEQNSKFSPQLDELTRLYSDEKERYSKLFAITEELEEELAKAKSENEIKDKWFERNVGMLENLKDSIVSRNLELKKIDESIIPREKEPIVYGSESEVTNTTTTETTTESSLSGTITTEKSDKISDDTSGIADKLVSEEKPEEEEGVTFKKVDLEPLKPPETSIEPPKETITDTTSKNEIIYEFTKIPNVDPLIADCLFNAGYTSLDKLKSATTEDLANIDGISPTMARKIRTSIFELED